MDKAKGVAVSGTPITVWGDWGLSVSARIFLANFTSNLPNKIRTLVQILSQIQVDGRIKTVFGLNLLTKHNDLGSLELD